MTTTNAPSTKLLRLIEVAELLNVSLPTVRRLVKEGRLQSVRVGRILRVRPEDLEGYIQSSMKKFAGHATNATGKGDQA